MWPCTYNDDRVDTAHTHTHTQRPTKQGDSSWNGYDDADDDVKCVGKCANRDDDDLTDAEWKKRRNKKLGMGFGITIGLICVLMIVAD